MHRALYVSEILRMVFDDLIQCNLERSTLNAAMATHLFTEPALDALWEDVDDLKVLLKLWPSEAACRDKITGLYWKFCRPLRISDWDRFDYYAFRVHKVRAELGRPSLSGMQDLIHDSFNHDLAKFMADAGRSTLLPNLTSLYVQGPFHKVAQLARLLITPGLTNLELCALSNMMNTGMAGPVLRSLMSLRPPLTSVCFPSLKVVELFTPFEAFLPAVLPSTLTKLFIHDTFFSAPAVATHIGNLPNLLELAVNSDYYRPVVFVDDSITQFRTLRTLEAGRTNLFHLVLHTPHVTRIVVSTLYDYYALDETEYLPSVPAFMTLVECLKTACPRLETIEVVWDKDDDCQCALPEQLGKLKIPWTDVPGAREVAVIVKELGDRPPV